MNQQQDPYPDINFYFNQSKFVCQGLEQHDQVIPEAKPIVKDMLKDLNKAGKKHCAKFPTYLIIFLLLYFVSIIALFILGLSRYVYAPALFLVIFLVSITVVNVKRYGYTKKVASICEEYQPKLQSYYNINNQFAMPAKNVRNRLNIYLVNVNKQQNNHPQPLPFIPFNQITYQQQGQFMPNQHPQNIYYHNQFQQQAQFHNINNPVTQDIPPNPPPVYNPPQDIPIYTHNVNDSKFNNNDFPSKEDGRINIKDKED